MTTMRINQIYLSVNRSKGRCDDDISIAGLAVRWMVGRSQAKWNGRSAAQSKDTKAYSTERCVGGAADSKTAEAVSAEQSPRTNCHLPLSCLVRVRLRPHTSADSSTRQVPVATIMQEIGM